VSVIRCAENGDAAQWLLQADVSWWDLVRFGPPGFEVYARVAFAEDEEVDAVRTALETLAGPRGHTPAANVVTPLMTREQKIPDASHPITISPTAGRVQVVVGGTVIADTTSSLTLQEASYPPVQYVPIAEVDPALLSRTETSTYCPFKGDASYFSLATPEGTVTDAAWTYDEAYDAVSEIKGHLAFYPDKATVTVEG
jgi:uncharacterized protein (DUF427 family)